MPAQLVMGFVAAAGFQHSPPDFVSGENRGQKILPCDCAANLAQCCDYRRHHDSARMVATTAVIEFKRVCRDTVDEARGAAVEHHRRAPDRRWTGSTAMNQTKGLQHRLGLKRGNACDRRPKRIEDMDFCLMNRRCRKVGKAHSRDIPRQRHGRMVSHGPVPYDNVRRYLEDAGFRAVLPALLSKRQSRRRWQAIHRHVEVCVAEAVRG